MVRSVSHAKVLPAGVLAGGSPDHGATAGVAEGALGTRWRGARRASRGRGTPGRFRGLFRGGRPGAPD
eukprot:2906655-Pyramimonas_sp.AAC.1